MYQVRLVCSTEQLPGYPGPALVMKRNKKCGVTAHAIQIRNGFTGSQVSTYLACLLSTHPPTHDQRPFGHNQQHSVTPAFLAPPVLLYSQFSSVPAVERYIVLVGVVSNTCTGW